LNLQRIRDRCCLKKIQAIIEETQVLEERGFITVAGLQLLRRCEGLWKHPEDDDAALAWAIRISARIYCPSFLALRSEISVEMARERIGANVLDIQRYQETRIRSALPDERVFEESQVPQLIDDLAMFLSGGQPESR
jgi:hypothetical protein